MPNMSYCRFQNTLSDLEDCKDTMRGMDQYYQSREDISRDEYSAMKDLVSVCREIVEMYDSEDHVFVEDDCASDDDDDS